jgi:hypothetical protein
MFLDVVSAQGVLGVLIERDDDAAAVEGGGLHESDCIRKSVVGSAG